MNLPTLTATRIYSRPDNEPLHPGSSRWRCTLNHKGRRISVTYSMGSAHTKEPKAIEVLGSLFSDAQCADSSRDYRDFSRDLGYDEDSIKGLKTYKACQSINIRLHKLLGSDYESLETHCRDAGY